MQLTYLIASILHAVFAVALVAIFKSPLLTLTSRRQFDEWSSLLDVYRSAPSINDTTILERSLHLAWCNETLPPNTTRAPYCRCVEKTHKTFENATNVSLSQARDDAAMDLVGCLSDRTVWRVAPVWSVCFATPAVYVFFIAACFLWIAADLPSKYSTLPIWIFALILVVVLILADYVHNSFWAFTFILIAVIISMILLPGMAMPMEGDGILSSSAVILDRTPSCFWWAEYLSTPIFALYVPLMHCGRDLFFVSVFTMIGTAVGGLGLRSYWCSQAYSDKPKEQFMQVMQYIVWLGILAACVSLSFLTGIYYSPDAPYIMGPGSVALLAITFCVSLLQWPGNQDFKQLLFTQMSLAQIRNVIFFVFVIMDVTKSD